MTSVNCYFKLSHTQGSRCKLAPYLSSMLIKGFALLRIGHIFQYERQIQNQRTKRNLPLLLSYPL